MNSHYTIHALSLGDIAVFARSQVEQLQAGRHGKMLYITSVELKEKVIQTLANKAEGM
jgi:hypothetical protein